MKFGCFFENKKGISSVMGVVLMIAITVVLAAAIGSSVFEPGTGGSAPQAIIDMEAVNGTHVKIEHLGGDPVNFAELSITKVVAGNISGSVELNFTGLGLFDVGRIQYLKLEKVSDPGVTISFPAGDTVAFKVIDVDSSTFIASKKLRF
ncbi:MAG: type IV pilin [Methanosarcinaceae archaeon]|nr:type IV pilin [Methanosarcinaceae archaeon]